MVGCYWLLLLKQKSNLSVRFKFEPITTNHLWFVVKMLWTHSKMVLFSFTFVVSPTMNLTNEPYQESERIRGGNIIHHTLRIYKNYSFKKLLQISLRTFDIIITPQVINSYTRVLVYNKEFHTHIYIYIYTLKLS